MRKLSRDGSKKGKRGYSFLDSLKFVIENAVYPSWDEVKSLSLDTTKITMILGTINLILYLIFHTVWPA